MGFFSGRTNFKKQEYAESSLITKFIVDIIFSILTFDMVSEEHFDFFENRKRFELLINQSNDIDLFEF